MLLNPLIQQTLFIVLVFPVAPRSVEILGRSDGEEVVVAEGGCVVWGRRAVGGRKEGMEVCLGVWKAGDDLS